jgi:hypothetical protein
LLLRDKPSHIPGSTRPGLGENERTAEKMTDMPHAWSATITFAGRRKTFTLLIAFVIYVAGGVWANSWTDERDFSDSPSRYTLGAARSFWSVFVTLDRDQDAERALKLSWLSVNEETYRKRNRNIRTLTDPLVVESAFIASYLRKYSGELSTARAERLATYLAIYLTRLQFLLPGFKQPILEGLIIQYRSQLEATSDPDLKLTWLREMMFRAFLERDEQAQERYQKVFASALNEHYPDIPASFRRGIVALYDGLLACIRGEPRSAVEPLAVATESFAAHPQAAVVFLRDDLHVLLLGKAKQDRAVCDRAINSVIAAAATPSIVHP